MEKRKNLGTGKFYSVNGAKLLEITEILSFDSKQGNYRGNVLLSQLPWNTLFDSPGLNEDNSLLAAAIVMQ